MKLHVLFAVVLFWMTASVEGSATARAWVQASTTLVCVGLGGESFGIDEWTAQQIADFEVRIGHTPPRPHPVTGECFDQAGLMVGVGWTETQSWLCTQRGDGTWMGPSWVASIYQKPGMVHPDSSTGSCPQPLYYPTIVRTEFENAAATAAYLTELEVRGEYGELYRWMHPDSQALVPESVMEGWYRDVYAFRPPVAFLVDDVRLVAWTWGVTGNVYASTAEVAYRQRFADGEEESGTVRLVRDNGVWRWFFGRDRAFVDGLIAEYGFP